jgi:hypothetical protein
MTTFRESRRALIVQALQSVDAEQVKPTKPKSESQRETDRAAAAATVLNAAYLREREARFGKAAPRVTATDVLVEALKDAQKGE